jgi:VWFA-related protein
MSRTESCGAGIVLSLLSLAFSCALRGQSSEGPVTPTANTRIQQAPPQNQARMRFQVALVNMPVTVRDSKGHLMPELEAPNFKITDNGVPQQITHFDLGTDPISLVVLMENSARVQNYLPELRKTGILITQTVMGPTGEAALVVFNDDITKLQDFTTNTDEIEKKISRLDVKTEGNRLYDAMAVGVEMLTSRPEPTADSPGRRRVMLLISEGTDVGSQAALGEVLRQAQVSNVTIYSVGLSTTKSELQGPPDQGHPIPPDVAMSKPPFPGSAPTPTNVGATYGTGNLMNAVVWAVTHVKDKVKGNPLELATAATGGMHVATFKDETVEKAIDEIGGELHAQYNISYRPTGTGAAGYHEIKVSVDKKNLKVRSRPGYYLGEPSS